MATSTVSATRRPGINRVAVVGGGFYGCFIALELRRLGFSVSVFESQPELLTRASLINQARIHQGYHYPRNFTTALRSRHNFQAFVDAYQRCVVSDFEHLYAVPRHFSRLSAQQFFEFARRVGAPITPAPQQARALFNPVLIEEVFSVVEYAFDAAVLREMLKEQLERAKVSVFTSCAVTAIRKVPEGFELVADNEPCDRVSHLFNCTYAGVNRVNTMAGAESVSLKYELAEIALVEPPEPLARMGVTVMDGSFFSCMPYPTTPYHSLTHVRYTPHGEVSADEFGAAHLPNPLPRTNFRAMVQDAARYVPRLGDVRYRESRFELKTLLPRSESDDGRPILFRESDIVPGFFYIMGGKIDNAFDLIPFLEELPARGLSPNSFDG